MSKTRITILVENTAGGPNVLAEHGLSYWIEHNDHRVLFDTGQSCMLASNAYKLGIPLREINALVLSHGHYDHTGGVTEALKFKRPVQIYVHPAAFAQKFIQKNDGTARNVSMPYSSQEAIKTSPLSWIATEHPTEISDGLMVTGSVPRVTDFEDTGGPFFLDEACTQPDPLEDDQSIFFNTAVGTVVLLGCAHSGIINTLRHIRRLTKNRPIHTIIGGMHLVGASSRRIKRTIKELKQIGVRQLVPAHCTGMSATVDLWKAFPGQCRTCPVGTQFEFEE